MSKRFAKYYFNEFRPITQLESRDLDNSKNMYRAFTATGALLCGFISFRVRRAQAGAAGAQGISKENNLPLYMLNDLMFGFIGFVCGQFFSQDYIYKQRQYVIERQMIEKRLNWNNRNTMPKDAPLLEEYPLTSYVKVSDQYIQEDRMNPKEQEGHEKAIKKNVENYHEEYLKAARARQQKLAEPSPQLQQVTDVNKTSASIAAVQEQTQLTQEGPGKE